MRLLPYVTHLATSISLFFFFFNDTATTEIYTLSLHDALPISPRSTHAAAADGRAATRPAERRRRRPRARTPAPPSRAVGASSCLAEQRELRGAGQPPQHRLPLKRRGAGGLPLAVDEPHRPARARVGARRAGRVPRQPLRAIVRDAGGQRPIAAAPHVDGPHPPIRAWRRASPAECP